LVGLYMTMSLLMLWTAPQPAPSAMGVCVGDDKKVRCFFCDAK